MSSNRQSFVSPPVRARVEPLERRQLLAGTSFGQLDLGAAKAAVTPRGYGSYVFTLVAPTTVSVELINGTATLYRNGAPVASGGRLSKSVLATGRYEVRSRPGGRRLEQVGLCRQLAAGDLDGLRHARSCHRCRQAGDGHPDL